MLQFDAKITSKDGKHILFVRGPVEVEDGEVMQFRLVPVSEMGKWQTIWKSEEVEDERSA